MQRTVLNQINREYRFQKSSPIILSGKVRPRLQSTRFTGRNIIPLARTKKWKMVHSPSQYFPVVQVEITKTTLSCQQHRTSHCKQCFRRERFPQYDKWEGCATRRWYTIPDFPAVSCLLLTSCSAAHSMTSFFGQASPQLRNFKIPPEEH